MNTYFVIAESQAGQITMETEYSFDAISLHDCCVQFREHGLFGDKPLRIERRFPNHTETFKIK